MTARVIAGFVVASIIALVAHNRRLLAASGAVAATIAGTLAVSAGVAWGALLVSYFVLASAISQWHKKEKQDRTGAVIEKRSARDAWQVFANGGVFVLAAVASSATSSDVAAGAALGALATAMADTAATEVGSAVGGEPRSIVSGQKVSPGISGGVTAAGTIALLIGSAMIGMIAAGVGLSWRIVFAGSLGGVAGGLADSLLGAVLQERRVCPACGAATERRVHSCTSDGVRTTVAGGVPRFDNDGVNLTSTALGALVAGFLSRGGV